MEDQKNYGYESSCYNAHCGPKTINYGYFTSLPDGTYKNTLMIDIIHLTTLSTDGLKGKPPIQIARESIGSSQAAQK